MWILFQLKHQKKVNNVILASQWEFSIKLHFFSTSIEKGFLVTWPVNSQKKTGSIQTLTSSFPKFQWNSTKFLLDPLLNIICFSLIQIFISATYFWTQNKDYQLDDLMFCWPLKHLKLVLRTIFTTKGLRTI